MDSLILWIPGLVIFFTFAFGRTVEAMFKNWFDLRIERKRQELQEKARDAEHKRRLELAEKVDTTVKVMIADETLAAVFRDKLNEIYPSPKVRVEVSEEEDDEKEVEQAQAAPSKKLHTESSSTST